MIAWDGTPDDFWAAVNLTRGNGDVESDAAVLCEVLERAQRRNLTELQQEAHKTAVAKGFYEGREPGPVWDACRLMKMVAELAEAFEEVKTSDQSYLRISEDGKPEGLSIELADAVILVMDFAESKDINLQQAIEIKMEYNKSRERLHGKRI